MSRINQKMVLAKRPQGAPVLDDFKVIESPVQELKDGEALLKTLYFSLDPYMRIKMSEGNTEGTSFVPGQPMLGGSVCLVEASKNPDLKVGDTVLANTGLQTYIIIKPRLLGKGFPWGDDVHEVKKIPHDLKASYYLGVLGMPGYTAYHGLVVVGEVKPGDTVVIPAATGAVGSIVGQLAKLKGCRVVGIAGGETKCRYAVEELGFDACVDHKSKTLAKDLAQACPKGIDIYVETVGGPIFWSVFPLLNEFARIPIIGGIAWYNYVGPLLEPGFKLNQIFPKLKAAYNMFFNIDRSPLLFMLSVGKRLKFQGFVIPDHMEGYNGFLKEIMPLVQSGKIKVKEDVVKGIEHAPEAFIGLLQGKNFGKLVIEV
jgi:NADPH-dependent curcumin reductase CurA